MTKSTITRERLEWLSQISCRDDIEDIGGDEIRELASMALAAMDSEPVAVTGNGLNVALSLTQMQIDWICNTCASIYNTRNDDVAQGYIDEIRATLERLAAMDNEPVFTLEVARADYKGQKLGNHFGFITLDAARELKEGNYQLYTAQPAPVVPDDVRQALSKMDDEIIAELDAEESVCRAAMLPAAPVRSSMPDGVVTAEHRRVIEMLLSVCGAAFELADDSCQQDVDGEECHVVPSDAFQKLSDALDEIENTLPTEDIDRPDVFLAWSAMPRAALKSLLQAGKSPAIPDGSAVAALTGIPMIPDGYVMVPKEPTAEMQSAGASAIRIETTALNKLWTGNSVFRAMLAAAPQSPGSEPATVPGKWIPVSERMPERGDWLVTDGCDFDVQLFNGEQFIPGFVWEDKITHWMPLPAAPQGVIHG